jgi:hypothetical protein
MNGTVNYSVEGAKYGISSGTALAIAISYTNNHSVLWAYWRRGHFRSGQVHPSGARRPRVLRVQGIRRLAGNRDQ